MIKQLLSLCVRCISLAALCSVLSARAQLSDKVLPRLILEDNSGAVFAINDLKITKPYVIAVVDTNLGSARSVIDMLKTPNFEGDGMVIILLKPLMANKQANPASWINDKELLPKAIWLWGSVSSVVQPLKLSATPAFIGLNANQQIVWRSVGISKPVETLTLQIKAWTTQPAASSPQR
jgi:hypothetical protein